MLLYLSVFVLLVFLAIAYAKIAKFFNIVDVPNERSSHTFPIVRGGGILFFGAAVLFFIFSEFKYPSFIVGLTILAILSFADDILSLKASLRLPFQFIAILFILYTFPYVNVPIWLMIVIPIIAVGFLNIYNFMDGINGITGLYSLAVLHGFWILSDHVKEVIPHDLLVFTFFSLIIFGYFNFRKKAKFFAGDVGSISVAAIILFIGIKFLITTSSPLILGLVLVYGIDAGLTLVRRIVRKENIFKAHREHLYQNLVDRKKYPHLLVSTGYALIQLMCNFIIFKGLSFELPYQYALFFILIGSTGLAYFMLIRWSKKENNHYLSLN